jgi:DNA-binding response OmpR family regulator
VKILVVEDEANIAEFVARGLRQQGFLVQVEMDGLAGLAAALEEEVDLLILDLNLPKLSGEQLLERLVVARPGLPVLVLSAKDSVEDQVRNLDAGADDYLPKPFSFVELLARVEARLRDRAPVVPAVLEYGRVRLDPHTRHVRVGDQAAELTAREFAVLEALMQHPRQVLSQRQLLSQVWGSDDDPGSNIVGVYVRHLRQKLHPDVIETVRGAGYRFVG